MIPFRRIHYISQGNIPSKWAHTFQAMKMAEAIGRIAPTTLVLSSGLLPGEERSVNLGDWYGVEQTFRIARLPVTWRRKTEIVEGVHNPRFDRIASWYARAFKPDLVYTRSIGAAIRCAQSGIKTIVEFHSSVEDLRRRQPDLVEVAKRAELLRVVTVTRYLAEQYLSIGLPESKLVVWPDAVDLVRYEGLPDRRAARERLGLPIDGPLAVYTGHLYESKGPSTLIEAARLAPEIHFLLVGGWPQDIERLRKKAGDLKNLTFTGFVSNRELPMYQASADVLLLPTSGRTEHALGTSPLKLFEYMAARRPLLASRIPALEDVVRDGENALLFEADNAASLASSLRTLLRDPGLSSRMADRAREDVEAYTWARRASSILEGHLGPGDDLRGVVVDKRPFEVGSMCGDDRKGSAFPGL